MPLLLFITQHILEYGDHTALKWLKENYLDEDIKEVVFKKRGLSHKTFKKVLTPNALKLLTEFNDEIKKFKKIKVADWRDIEEITPRSGLVIYAEILRAFRVNELEKAHLPRAFSNRGYRAMEIGGSCRTKKIIN